MAAFTTVTPVAPSGIEFGDGFPTTIGFGKDPNIALWIHEVAPPGVEGGEAIEQTSMHATAWKTYIAGPLLDLEPMTLVCGYDPEAYNQCIAIINADTGSTAGVTILFPDGSTLDFWGFMQSFKPQNMRRREKPMANVVIKPTNYDPVNKVEAAPVLTEVAGT